MKKRLLLVPTLSLLCLINYAQGASYHVATSGDNTNPGTIGSPFRTIQQAAAIANPGDKIYIHEGVYRETVRPAKSGTNGSMIEFIAYNNDKVIVSGCDQVTGWSPHSGNIWKARVNWSMDSGEGDLVFINGEMKFEGQYPNTSDMMARSTWGSMNSMDMENGAWLQADDLKGFGNDFWKGYMIRNHFTNWTIKNSKIASYESTTGKVTFDVPYGKPQYWAKDGRKYYIYGGLKVLDAPGEWYKGTDSLYLVVLPGQDPNNLDIEFKKRNYVFDLQGLEYIRVSGITLRGAFVLMNSSTKYNKYDRNYFVGTGKGASGRMDFPGTGNILRDNEIHKTWRGVGLDGSYHQIVNNYFHDCGYYGGNASALNMAGSNQLISYNTFSNIGRNVSQTIGTRCEIEYNVFEDCGNLSFDTGALEWQDAGSSFVHHNIFRNNQQAVQPFTSMYGGVSNIIIHHNIMHDVLSGSIYLGSDMFVHCFNNTFYGPSPFGWYGAANYSRYWNNLQGSADLINGENFSLQGLYNNYTDGDFVNAATKDFRLSSGSGAIDAGFHIPGITDGYAGNAPDAGALEYGQEMWKVGHDFNAPPNPVYDWKPIDMLNQVENSTFTAPFTGWDTKGSPARVHGNSWNFMFVNGLARYNEYSILMKRGDQISKVFTGLKPNTWYYAGSNCRIVGKVLETEKYSSASRSLSTGSHRGEDGVTGLTTGDWICFKDIDFGPKAPLYNRLELPYAWEKTDITFKIEVHMDSPSGKLLGTFSFNSDSWVWWISELSIPPVTGTHSVYLVAIGNGGTNILDHLRFMDTRISPDEKLSMGARNFGISETGNQIRSMLGDYYWPENFWLFPFKTGPSATSAELYFSCNNLSENYLDGVVLFEGKPSGKNIAPYGVAQQSTTTGNNVASNAIDSTILGGPPSTTENIPNSWWELDLGEEKRIYEIMLTAPEDFPGRLSNFRVSLRNSGGTEVWGANYLGQEKMASGETLFIQSTELNDNDYSTKLRDVKFRFIRILLNGNNLDNTGSLSLGELRLIENDAANKANFAGIAKQSTTFGTRIAQLAIDGNSNPNINQGSVTQTTDMPNSWWQVSFGRCLPIGAIEIANSSTEAARLSNFQVSVWDNDPEKGGTKLWAKDYFKEGNVPASEILTVHGSDIGNDTLTRLSSVFGRVVRIQLNGNNNAGNGTLSLAEVRVYDTRERPPVENVARHGVATQSSNNSPVSQHAEALIDGNMNPSNYGETLSRTKNEYEPWWQLDLKQAYKLDQIYIFNRNATPLRVTLWDNDPKNGGKKLWDKTFDKENSIQIHAAIDASGKKLGNVENVRFIHIQWVGKTAGMIMAEVQAWSKGAVHTVDPKLTEYKYDLGTPISPVEKGWTRISPATGGDIYWSHFIDATNHLTNVADVKRDFVSSTSPTILEHKIENGTWEVILTMGNYIVGYDSMMVKAESNIIGNNISTTPNTFAEVKFNVTVSDGRLSLVFADAGGIEPHWALNSMVIRKPINDPINSTKIEDEEDAFNILPNPAYNYLKINYSGELKKSARIFIHNNIGSIVKSTSMDFKQKIIEINDLAPGIYIIRLLNGDKCLSLKFIKE